MPGKKKSFILIIFFFIILFQGNKVYAQNKILNQELNIHFKNTTVDQALIQLTAEYKIPLSFDPALLKEKGRINKKFLTTPLSDILDYLLSGTSLTYKQVQNEIILMPAETKSATISGHIQDAENGEDIIGANIFIPALKQGISSNNYGYYALTLPPSRYEVSVSHVGFMTKKLTVNLQQTSQIHNIVLDKQPNNLKEVKVNKEATGDSADRFSPAGSLDWELMKKQPYYKGETDVIKALQMQNGILGMTEGSSNIFVRGGNKDQNLILLDEAIVYNPAHLLGLTSIFNPDALKNIQIYNDDIPANFGGRLSSVIDARMTDGDDKSFHFKGGVSLLTARLAVEGPIVKEKGSFLIAARKSLTNLLDKDFEIFNLAPGYYDLNLKVNYKFGPSNRLFYSAYIGNDRLKSANNYFNKWGNQTSTLRWNHIFSAKLFLNLSAIYSNYRNELNINADAAAGMDQWVTGIRDATLKGDFTFYSKPHSQFQFGFSSILHLFIPGEAVTADALSIPRAKAGEYAIYATHKLDLGQRIRLLYGLRGSLLQNISTSKLVILDDDFNVIYPQFNPEGGYQKYFRLEPRLMVQYAFQPQNYLQFTYNRNYQYLQLVQNDELAFTSLETWIPSSPNLKPQQSDLFSIAYKKENKDYSFSLNAYYKKMLNQLELIDHAQIILNPIIEDQLRPGNATSYGTEFMVSKNMGRFKGTLFYTWSRAFRKIDQINNNLKYPANYDIPHSFKLSLNYQITNQLSLSSYFTYTTGRPVTSPLGYFMQQGIRVPIYSERNSSRIADYHRLDINLTWDINAPDPNRKRRWSNSLSAGLYNLYNRRNSLYYKVNQSPSASSLVEAQAFSGITPSITYNFRF